jgi:lipopolysaccharide biosynthesis glycosyltransferase
MAGTHRGDDVIRVFIGYDPREAVAFSVLAHSIHVHATAPVSATPLRLSQLAGLFTRPRDPLQSTDFAFSRFLTPYLSGYEGWSLFMDCDMLVRDDIAKLWALRDDAFAVMVVKHDHRPREDVKFLGHAQTAYAKKNWSSVMLFNNARCRNLTPEYVNTASGLELHQFKWLESDSLIGELPRRWNHLVGYDDVDPHAAIVHYTLGGPYFDDYAQCEYADEWRAALTDMLHASKSARPVLASSI